MTGLSFISIVGILTIFNGSLGFVPPSPSRRFSQHTSTFIPPITSTSNNNIRVGSIELAAKKKNKSVNKATEADVDELINGGSVATIAEEQPYTASEIITALDNIEEEEEEVETEEMKHDKQMMLLAINMASSGGERGSHGPFPKPRCGAVLVAKDGRVSLIYIIDLSMHNLCTLNYSNIPSHIQTDSRKGKVELRRTCNRICFPGSWYRIDTITRVVCILAI